MAQLGKNLGHFILYQEDLPGALVRSALTTRLDTWRGGVGVVVGLRRGRSGALSEAGSALSPRPQLSQGKCNDSVSFLS